MELFNQLTDQLFEKKFHFNCENLPELDAIDDCYLCSPRWEFIEGSSLQRDLDEVRSKLDDKDLISWGKHTNQTDLSGFVNRNLIKKEPNMRNEFLTRAWTKLMEILISFPLIKFTNGHEGNQDVTGLFLCEAPGSFVNAANYYIKSKEPSTNFDWLATSLNPYYEEIDSTKRWSIGVDGFIRTEGIYDKWFFGEDNRGDLLEVSFIKQICYKFTNSKVDFVTGDGGINFIDQPEAQEEHSFPLIYHQFLTAINCLKPGGSAVLKMFTLFSSQTLCLVYLFVDLFEQVTCTKPVLSKSGSSEVYFVCIGLKDGKKDLISQLTDIYLEKREQVTDNVLFTHSLLTSSIIPSSFVQQFIDCSRRFKDYQKSAIIANLTLYAYPFKLRGKIYKNLNTLKEKVSCRLMERFALQPIVPYLQLCFDHNCSPMVMHRFKYFDFSLSAAVFSPESYEKRKTKVRLVEKEKITTVLRNLYDRKEVEAILTGWKTVWSSDHLPPIVIKFGKPFNNITNSKFVDRNLLCLYNQIIQTGNKEIPLTGSGQDTISSIDKTRFRFDSLLQRDLDRFDSVIGPKLSSVVNFILSGSTQSPRIINNTQHLHDDIDLGRSIVIIDPYDNSPQQFNSSKCAGVSIIEREQDLVEKIVQQLSDYLRLIKMNDILILHVSSVLSRLMVEIIYCLSSMFKEIAIIPNFTSKINHPNKSYQQQLGMLILLGNLKSSADNGYFDKIKSSIMETIDLIKNNYITGHKDKALLEIFPVPKVLKNGSFTRLMFTGNFVHLVEKMESISTESIDCSLKDDQ